MKQNITLSLDKEILRKSKILAARKETSISRLLAESIERAVEDAEAYESAKRSGLHAMKKAFHLGGARHWRREDLYDR
jgi:predicted transcriptional regulator